MSLHGLETIQQYRERAKSVLMQHRHPTDYDGVLELSKTPDLERHIQHAIRMIISAHMAEKYIKDGRADLAISHTATLAEKSIELWLAEHHPEIGGAGTLPDMVNRINKNHSKIIDTKKTKNAREKAGKPFEERRQKITDVANAKYGWKLDEPHLSLQEWKKVRATVRTTYPKYKKVTDRQLNADAKIIGLRPK